MDPTLACQKILSESSQDLQSSICAHTGLPLSDPQSHRLLEEFIGWGPLSVLWKDTSVTEIIVNGSENIWFERAGLFSKLDDRFLTETTFANFIHRLCERAEMVVDLNFPFADGTIDEFRVHYIRPPLTPLPQVSLRRQSNSPWTLDRLRQADWAAPKTLDLLAQKVRDRSNILIVGSTGTGKTAVLNACLQELPENERVICIEDTSELIVPNSASCKLLTRTDSNGVLKNFDLNDLIRQSLRMRPSRLVVGEVRGAEARDLLLSLATGHSGSLGTLHANSARQALLRLEMLIQMGAPNWSIDAIRQLIFLSLQTIVVVGMEGGRRKCEGIYQISSLEQIGFLLERLD